MVCGSEESDIIPEPYVLWAIYFEPSINVIGPLSMPLRYTAKNSVQFEKPLENPKKLLTDWKNTKMRNLVA